MTMPFMVKNYRNLFWNQDADDAETWYTASGTWLPPFFFFFFSNDAPDQSYERVKFVS